MTPPPSLLCAGGRCAIVPVAADEVVWLIPADLPADLDRERRPLLLRRWGPLDGPPVMLVHGLSAQSNTFETNERSGHHLAGWLRAAGYTVWLLDYRGTSRPSVLERFKLIDTHDAADLTAAFRFGATARHDIGGAIREISARHGDRPVHVVAHCVGGGLTALALALEPDLPVGALVLSTLGLFYKVPFVREVKIWSMVGEYFRAEHGQHWLDPWDAEEWAKSRSAYHYLSDAERAWTRVRLGKMSLAPPDDCETFVRLSFLYGEPYDPKRLPRMHAEAQAYEARGSQGPLPAMRQAFGRLNLGLMVDVAENLRAGRPTADCVSALAPDTPLLAEPVDAEPARRPCPHRIRRGQLADDPSVACPIDPEGDPFSPAPFLERPLLLLTGRHNRLWHRDAIAAMHNWLLDRGADPARARRRILPGYAHQDLLWAEAAWDEVYPLIGETLRQA